MSLCVILRLLRKKGRVKVKVLSLVQSPGCAPIDLNTLKALPGSASFSSSTLFLIKPLAAALYLLENNAANCLYLADLPFLLYSLCFLGIQSLWLVWIGFRNV